MLKTILRHATKLVVFTVAVFSLGIAIVNQSWIMMGVSGFLIGFVGRILFWDLIESS